MRRDEAGKLLGGYATDTLTGTERRVLFEAALEHQELFEALADEEALRELLADPAARAHLLAALAPRVVPLWRRPGVLGLAAGLLVAGLAGLAVLHGPGGVAVPRTEAPRPSPRAEGTDPMPKREAAAPAARAPEPAVPAPPARKVAPPPPAPVPAPAPRELPASNRVIEAPAALAPGVAAGTLERKRTEDRLEAEDAAKARAQADRASAGAGAVMEAIPSAPAPGAPVAGVFRAAEAEAAPEPAWGVATRADGSVRVTVLALPGRPVLLLRRGAAGVAVVRPVEEGREGPRIRWRIDLRPVPGETLDLYILNAPVADPARLPAVGPVDGFRTRIPVPEKKAPAP